MRDLDVRRALELRAEIARERDGRHVVIGGADASVERHRDELFGRESAPDFTPLDARYVPPKKVLMEWVGEPSPFDSELVRALRLKGLLSPIHRLVLEKISLMRRARVDRVTAWVLGPREGLTKQYRFGKMPGTFVQEVEFADVDRLLELGQTRIGAPGNYVNQFRVLGSRAEALPPVAPDEAWAKVIADISHKQGIPGLPPGAERLRITAGREEKLVKMNAAGTYGHWKS